MGASGISPTEILVILVVVALLFGSGRLRGIAADLGAAIRGFRSGLRDEPPSAGEKNTSVDP